MKGKIDMDLAEKVALAEKEQAKLVTQLEETEKKVTARDTLITAKDEEIKTLKADIKARDDKELERVVEERFLTWKDKKPVSKEFMLATARADRALFDKEFPHIDADKRHLNMRVTPTVQNEQRGAASQIDPTENANGVPLNETLDDTINRLMRDEKLSYESASNKAFKLRNG